MIYIWEDDYLSVSMILYGISLTSNYIKISYVVIGVLNELSLKLFGIYHNSIIN